MPTAYTSLLGLALPVTGELQGTWGTTVNDAITSLLDTAVAGTTTLSTDADVTLSTTTGAANQARQAIILWTANGSVTRNITAPAQSKAYIVINATAGSQNIVIRGVGPTTGVTIAPATRVLVVWNGSDFVRVASSEFPGAGIAVSTGSTWTTSLTAPTGAVVGTTDTQTLTNKTLVAPTVLASTTTTQDGVVVTGRAGGTSSYRVTLAPTTLTASRAVTLPNLDGTVVLDTAVQTLTNKTISADNNTLSGIAASSFVLSNASGNIDGAAVQKAIPSGVVVGDTDSQTLTNKTISADSNTLSGIAASSFVLSNASGNIDGAAAQKAIPTGVVVGTTDSQTLTNKTISADNNTLSGIAASSFVLSNASGNIDGAAAQKAIPTGVVVGDTDTQTLTNKTLDAPTINNGYTEEVFAVSGTTPALSPTNGSIQTWTLTANSTPTAGTWAAGQSLTLMVNNATAYTITWTSVPVTWKTNLGAAPTLNNTGFTAIQLWKVGSTIYGARVGDA